ncbi:phosphodiesterase [Microtetraspora sp. NBRC 13810]|uniref:alkaline phosphatase family protein n=1 Tax=Microtetraspora sp. NBRC 13810 TaxID=3030990 RepID=UPI0024A3D4CA|nr:alkaline phosphatase family protein [Microtetraspora sp. NBRC 13810]GLW09957.1 phosphodiesterase [Microtetraspora sp. NBRC 13810]
MDLPVFGDTPHIGRIVPSILAALGVPAFHNTVDVPEVSGACLLLIDGLGWELLEAHPEDAPVLTSLARTPFQVGFPSTTVAGLAAYGTGLATGEHGMTGYTFDLPGTGMLNALRWRTHPEGVDLRQTLPAQEVQPLPTTFARAAAAGVEATVVSSAQFAGTPLTNAVQRGGRYVGVHALGDLAAAALRAVRGPRGFCYAYHADLDAMGHLYGPGSAEWRMQLRQVDRLVESLADGLPPGGMLGVVADHGMVRLDGSVLDLEQAPHLLAGVRAVGGEVRARHLYTSDGTAPDVVAAWREEVGSRAWVATREEAIEAGWFGPTVSDRVRPRIGDVLVAAKGGFGMVRRLAEPRESALIGQHGSITSAEQLVPFAVAYG